MMAFPRCEYVHTEVYLVPKNGVRMAGHYSGSHDPAYSREVTREEVRVGVN